MSDGQLWLCCHYPDTPYGMERVALYEIEAAGRDDTAFRVSVLNL
ncbi:hypothetical protein [Atopococcus tabaci]|nr:hypothetical protein [Atopococcus tabaci]